MKREDKPTIKRVLSPTGEWCWECSDLRRSDTVGRHFTPIEAYWAWEWRAGIDYLLHEYGRKCRC
jgi:hypothetical protein